MTARCPRPRCGGTLIDGERCHLCGRTPEAEEGPTAPDLRAIELNALMQQPPGPPRASRRTAIDESMYERPERRGPVRWLPWAGFDGLASAGPGRPETIDSDEIRRLANAGLTRYEIVKEGQERKAAGLDGWPTGAVYRVLSNG